jgi:pSer/pThr/pTyr-binding forkhead associated (FHA) protein
MTRENDQVAVRDLYSTNGIRINGMRVETGRLRPGDELSIAHIRYRLEGGEGSEKTSDSAIREQASTPDSSRLSNWIHSPKWGVGPAHKG